MTAGTRQVSRPKSFVAPQTMVAAISASLGNRPIAFFENRSFPSTVTSKTPPPDFRSDTFAAESFARIRSRAALARGS